MPLMERITKGVLYPEHTKDIYEKIPGSEKWPLWGRLLAGVSETIVKYGVAGLGKGVLKAKLFSRKIARDINAAAEKGAEDLIMSKGGKVIVDAPKGAGVTTGKTAVMQAEKDAV